MQTTMNGSNAAPEKPTAGGGSSGAVFDFFKLLDELLRRRGTLFEEVFNGQRVWARIWWFVVAIVVLSGFYGGTMGAMGFTAELQRGVLQSLTSAVKVPVLFLLSVAICLPVLYIVLVLMGARLSFAQTLALILLALALNSVLLASCAPIVLFFTVTGSDYHFIKLLHVAVFGFSGFWAMKALWQGLWAMCEKSDLYPKRAVSILKVWILVFGFVGTQMAWSLRPFVGSPGLGYTLFRSGQAGNFYTAVWASARSLARGQAPAPVSDADPQATPANK
jgi:hypothetical protein